MHIRHKLVWSTLIGRIVPIYIKDVPNKYERMYMHIHHMFVFIYFLSRSID
jgi:hypothetical protein